MEELVPLRSAVLSDPAHCATHAVDAKAATTGRQRFKFQQRTAKLDLRKIASVNLENIIQHVDITILQVRASWLHPSPCVSNVNVGVQGFVGKHYVRGCLSR